VYAALGFGVGLGVVLAITVAGPLTADLRALAAAAGDVARGDLSVRTRIERADEVGVLARAIDTMVVRLGDLQRERERDEAARRQLFASISHDLRTPLASLQAATEALQDGVAADPDRYLRSMANDLDLLRGMVDDLFLVSRLDAGAVQLEPMAVDLVELADGAVEAMASVAARGVVDLAVDAGGPVHVTADPRAVTRVLRNLIDNAVRHAPPGSTVTVEVRDGSRHSVRVIDEGPGFDPAFAPLAFDVFSRADDARTRSGGTGLGLAIAKGLVEAHGGDIWVDAGDGGVVGFSLPGAAGHPPPVRLGGLAQR
jgi:signal transduction histidine kinase